MFLSINGILAEKKLGLQTRKERPEIALKRFMICEGCNEPLRGYIANSCDTAYYKCNTPGCHCNRKANEVNKKFLGLLGGYNINVKYAKLIAHGLKKTFMSMNASVEENQAAARARMTELGKKIERLEERYILEEINGELYGKYKQKFEQERDEIDAQISKNRIEMSKLEDYISVSLNYAVNLSKMWASGDYTQRQELQNAFFPDGISYNRQKDECRNLGVNEFLAESTLLSGRLANFSPDKIKKFKLSSVGAVRTKSRTTCHCFSHLTL